LAVWFHRLVERPVDADVPIVFVAFPRLIEDANYVYEKLRPFLPPGTTADQARASHRQVADLERVRVERELRDEATRVPPRADATEPEYPSRHDLSAGAPPEVDQPRWEIEQRLAEVDRLRWEMEQGRADVAQGSAEMAALQARLTRRSARSRTLSSVLVAVYQSRSWRLTKPLRALRNFWRRV
jgi:hypothetical protein